MNRIVQIAATAVAASLFASAACAGDDIMVVRMGDLNVASHQGAEAALKRIRNAATQFCGPETRDLGATIEQKRCATRMTHRAVAILNAPMVSALHAPNSQIIELARADSLAR